MNEIYKEFDLRIENQEVKGTYKWIFNCDFKHGNKSYHDGYKLFKKHIEDLPKADYTPKQHLIFYLALSRSMSTFDRQELAIDLSLLDDDSIDELMVFYDIEKPVQRYQELKNAIAGPTSYTTNVPYNFIRELHKRGKAPFDRQIFAACLIRFNTSQSVSYSKPLTESAKEKILSIFPLDDFTIDILMAVFEMELGVDDAHYLHKDYSIGAIIMELVHTNRIPRATIQQKLFDAFNNPTLKLRTHGWAKNIYRDLAFSTEENIACQEQLIQLLYNDRTLLVNIGLQQLKKIASHKSFLWELFINSLDGMVYKEKLVGGLKTALAILYKGIKKDQSLIEPCCLNLAPIFLQQDNAVQMAAKDCFLLLETPNNSISEALLPFVDTMHSEVKQSLNNLLQTEDVTEESHHNSYEIYKQEAYTPVPYTSDNKITYIDNENDFIFLLSKVMKSTEALDYELFLESILRYSYLKDTQPKVLKPALKQAKKIAFSLSSPPNIGLHHILAARLICLWLSPTAQTIEMDMQKWKDKVEKEKNKKDNKDHMAKRWHAVFDQFKRISYLESQLLKKENCPLLSTPTHNHFEIDLSIFLERLAKYDTADKSPDEGDFCIALCRLNRWTSFDKTDLKTANKYHKILDYLLDDQATFDPNDIKTDYKSWLTAYALKNPEKSIDALIASIKKEEWWATSSLWNWEIIREYSEDKQHNWNFLKTSYKHQRNDVTQQLSHFEHNLTNTGFIINEVDHSFTRNGFLQEPLFLTLTPHYDLEASDSKWMLALIKHQAIHPFPLGKAGYLFINSTLFCSIKTVRMAAFDWLSILIENNYLNIDLFISSASKFIISEDHPTPLSRVAEQFDRLLQMQGVYLDILHQLILTSLRRVNPTDIPKSFGKILHHYHEILQLIKTPIPQDISIIIDQLKNTSSVKKEVKKLLNM